MVELVKTLLEMSPEQIAEFCKAHPYHAAKVQMALRKLKAVLGHDVKLSLCMGSLSPLMRICSGIRNISQEVLYVKGNRVTRSHKKDEEKDGAGNHCSEGHYAAY